LVISDGQAAVAATWNDAFVSKSANSTTTAVITLNASGSGSQVDDVQQDINDLKSDVIIAQGDISAAEANITTLLTDMSIAQGDISDLQSDMSTAQSDISTLQAHDIDASAIATGHVNTTDQTFAGHKTFNGIVSVESNILMKENTTPSTPAGGYNYLYFKNDQKLYAKSGTTGDETPIGSGGGGGGGSLQWIEDENAPLTDIEYFQRVYKFQVGLAQCLYAGIKVPDSYVAGNPINLILGVYSPGTADFILMQTVSTLIAEGTAFSSTTNQHTSINAEVELDAPARARMLVSLDLTDGSGLINGVGVAAGDLIKVKLTRTATSGTDSSEDVRAIVYDAEVTFE
jgi:hypothetical protein